MKVSIEGQGHFLTFFQVLYILCLYEAQISGERLQDHWSSVFFLTPLRPHFYLIHTGLRGSVLHGRLFPDVCSNDDPGLTLTYFTARSNFVT